MKLFGLIGHPLSHSFSKKYFEEKFKKEGIEDCKYELFDLENCTELARVIDSNPDLIGLNVTIPHKEKAISLLDEIDSIAQEIGAVNTIRIDQFSKKLKGYNTDYFGFKNSLKPFLNHHHERALILGTGGASKAVEYALKDLNISCLKVSRNPQYDNEISYDEVNEFVILHHKLIVNTTPLGMSPNTTDCPNIPYEQLSENHFLYDLVYNPDETVFLRKGREKGCLTLNGLSMLKLQAEKAWEIWNS